VFIVSDYYASRIGGIPREIAFLSFTLHSAVGRFNRTVRHECTAVFCSSTSSLLKYHINSEEVSLTG
jgi:hypothetical protein